MKSTQMKKVICLILAVALAAVCVGCGGETGNSIPSAPATAPSEGASSEKDADSNSEKIVIANLVPMTGEMSAFGEPEFNTLQMLVDKQNEEGGILGMQLELKTYDTRGDNVETVNAAKKAIQNDNVNVVIGCTSSGPSIALAEICTEYKIPQIVTTGTNTKVTVDDSGNVRPYTFRVGLADPQISELIAEYAYYEMGIKTVGILYEISSDYSVGLKDDFINAFVASGGEIVAEEAYKMGDVDFRAQLTKLKDCGADALFLPCTYKELGLATKQARDLGVEQQFIGPDCWIAKDLFDVAGDALEGAYFVAPIPSDDPRLEEFNDWYRGVFNKEPDDSGSNAYFAYDAFELLKKAIEIAGSAEPQAIADALQGITEVPGILGPFSMNPDNHNPNREATIMRIENQSFVPVVKASPDDH
ncbi:ABC transporter substrate-binding protein [Ruminococcaceae bacterium OttesenSCG-928-D13]|nr:ABC transporter substrate-binding protein [Ruminococcaceae bacterium OttesenSCG-928-D13]